MMDNEKDRRSTDWGYIRVCSGNSNVSELEILHRKDDSGWIMPQKSFYSEKSTIFEVVTP